MKLFKMPIEVLDFLHSLPEDICSDVFGAIINYITSGVDSETTLQGESLAAYITAKEMLKPFLKEPGSITHINFSRVPVDITPEEIERIVAACSPRPTRRQRRAARQAEQRARKRAFRAFSRERMARRV